MDSETSTEIKGDPQPEAAPVQRRSEREVKAYHKAKRTYHLADIAVSLSYWLVWLIVADHFVDGLRAYTHLRWLALPVAAGAMFGGLVLVSLPLGYANSFLLERRYNLTNQTPWTWLVFEMKGWLVGGVLAGILLSGLYALLWYGGRWWSVWVWIGVMLFSVGLAKVFPLLILPLFYPSKPLDRPSLSDRLKVLAGGSGMAITGIFNLELSKETKKANAMLAGLGSSRRVYLSDTLLDAFNDKQIAVVFAHELGHHIRGHIHKGIGLAAVVSSGLVALLHWRLNEFAGGNPAQWETPVARLSQVGLIIGVFPLLIGPLTNAISRHFERQADADALRLTDDPDAYRSAFQTLTDLNLADPAPPRWEEILFDDHPPMAKRMAMADRYVKQRIESPLT